jgi:hypothetical protein
VKHTLVNFAAFQVGWFACVLGAAHGIPWAGPVAVVQVIALHLVLAENPVRETRLICLALVMGFVVDSLLAASGWLRYASPLPSTLLAPYWILAMWALFATTLNVSLHWLKGHAGLSVLLGAVLGPLSYIAGQRLGALEFADFRAGALALAVAWALAMPLLMRAAAHFDGVRSPETQAGSKPFPPGVTAGD